jgi:hypothetical protein
LLPARHALDGETPTLLIVTQEANGYGVFITSFDDGDKLLKWFGPSDKYTAIEHGVFTADEMLQQRAVQQEEAA